MLKKLGLYFLAMIFLIPAFVGIFVFFLNISDNVWQGMWGLVLMSPEVLVWVFFGKLYTMGKKGFFATLPPEVSRRHYWDGTGFGIDSARHVLLLRNGKDRSQYDFDHVKSIEKRSRTGGEVMHTGGRLTVGTSLNISAHNFGTMLANQETSGLFITVADLDRPVWQLKFSSEKEMDRWFAVINQAVLGN